jgi:iron complex transport system substrate-binding protein
MRHWVARAAIGMQAGALLSILATTVADARPERIVSINVCTDQLLLLVADRSQIRAVTHLAANPFFSNWAARAKGLPRTRGLAEEVMTLRPDLVLAGPFSPKATVALLRRLRFRVAVLPVASSLDDVRKNIRQVGRLTGNAARAEKVVAGFDTRLRRQPTPARRPTVAFYWLGGYSTGSATLAGDAARAAGFENLADRAGLAHVGPLPMETLISGRPDALVLAVSRDDPPSLSRQVLHHPALRRLLRDRPWTTVPSRLWVCGTPAVADAVDRLKALRRKVGP